MASNFKLNKAGLDKAVKDSVKEQAKETQALLDKLLRTHKGKPVPEVKTALLREWRRSGGKMADAEATEWATALSEGRRIVLKS
jgi:hypothetical protein